MWTDWDSFSSEGRKENRTLKNQQPPNLHICHFLIKESPTLGLQQTSKEELIHLQTIPSWKQSV